LGADSEVGIAFHDALKPATDNVLNDSAIAAEAIKKFRSLITSTQKYHEAEFKVFKGKAVISKT